ncbi:TetR/AcrR family transcriptional regulator [Desulfobotulus sp. H1]|uniref:TetR/AcrR family transcriptional regulator n=1 Tax=Desulfobotulus pelophilus TaxID=2823377 RepID=A0ABT3N4Z8_9BACT|nr:TetR/AcrR family transcriptional regulator [Desulfobotulus pelophilus]MCW7752519.1 TetR/AcrR family transcriptional regulator [Desulfobotulus pelophilus]
MRKRQNAQERKPVILDAFYAAIREEGIENASVAKVAARAGIHPSLVIHYFGTKEKMLMELVDQVLETYGALIGSLPRDGAPGERLLRILATIWGPSWYGAVAPSVVYSFLAIARRNQEVARRVDHLYGKYRRFLEKEVAAAAAAGVVSVRDVPASVSALLSLSEGSHYFRHHFGGSEEAHRQAMMRAALIILGASPEVMVLYEGGFGSGGVESS